ncbi:serine aminopeptidase domain-containing protein [Cupriavidus sp. CuC1]
MRGVVQIAHGMGEHIGRYVGVIEALVSAGFEGAVRLYPR